jgi:hypothetical protein
MPLAVRSRGEAVSPIFARLWEDRMTQSEIELDLGEETVSCTPEEIATAFAGLLREMRAAAAFVTAEERAALRKIMSYDSGALTVADVFPDFERDSAAHVALRRLRTAQFILPAGRDMWDRDQHVAIKPFARLVWDRLGEAAIFGDEEEKKPADPDPEEIDLSLPEVNAPENAETVRAKGKTAAWDDDDVLDFLQDTPG